MRVKPRRHASWPLLCLLALPLVLQSCSSLPAGQTEPVLNDKAKAARDYGVLGETNMLAGNTTQAENYYRLALETQYSIDNLPGVVESANALGNLYLAMEDWKAARLHFDEALKIATIAGDPVLEGKALSNLAKLQISEAQYETALGTLDQAEARLASAPPAIQAVVHHNRGMALDRLGQADKAVASLEKALGLNVQAKVRREQAANLYLMASIRSRSGQFTEARDLLLRALALDKEIEHTRGIASDLYGLYTVSLKLSQKEEAYRWAIRAFRTSLAGNNVSMVEKCLQALEPLARELGYETEAAQWKAYMETLKKGAAK